MGDTLWQDYIQVFLNFRHQDFVIRYSDTEWIVVWFKLVLNSLFSSMILNLLFMSGSSKHTFYCRFLVHNLCLSPIFYNKLFLKRFIVHSVKISLPLFIWLYTSNKYLKSVIFQWLLIISMLTMMAGLVPQNQHHVHTLISMVTTFGKRYCICNSIFHIYISDSASKSSCLQHFWQRCLITSCFP